MSAVAALRADRLNRWFGGVQATTDVSFEVAEGTIMALIGPNGAGKTTIFNLVTNVFPAQSGTVSLFGTPLTGWSSNRIAAAGLIRTFQSARVFPGMTVLENAMVGRHRLHRGTILGAALGLPGARREERRTTACAEGLLELAGLAQWRDRHAALLPMGAQKMLEIVRALMARPRVLLLDEPAAGLNDTETAELATMLQAIRLAGITVLLVEHNMPLVMGVADQVTVLEAGRVIAAGPPAAIQADPHVIAAYLGAPPDPVVEAVA